MVDTNVPNILKKININKENKFKLITKILNIKKKYKLKFDNINNEINVLDNNKKIFVATYDFYGIIKPNGQFFWSYMIPGANLKFVDKIEKIKNMSYLFENSSHPDMLLFHRILTQDSILLTDQLIEKVLSLLLYLGGNKYYFNSINTNGNIQLIFINKITEQVI